MSDAQTIKALILASVELGTKWIGQGYQAIRQRLDLDGDREELIKKLFLDQGEFLFHPSKDWSPAAGQSVAPPAGTGYPHDINALSSFDAFLPYLTKVKDSLVFDEKLMPTTRLICSGSPKANRFSRQYLPSYVVTEGGSRLQYDIAIAPNRLSYLFGEDPTAPMIEVMSMMHRRPELKTRKIIWRWHKGTLRPWSPVAYERAGKLNKDFLLISRLPRHRAGSDILVLAGAHGAGTEAISLFLHKFPIRELRELVDRVGESPYFQFVLEVSDIHHSESGTAPGKVKLSDDLPLVVLDDLTSRDLGTGLKADKK